MAQLVSDLTGRAQSPRHRRQLRRRKRHTEQTHRKRVKTLCVHQSRDGLLTDQSGQHRVDKRSEEHTSELQSRENLVCRLLLEKKKKQEYKNQLYKKKKHMNTTKYY